MPNPSRSNSLTSSSFEPLLSKLAANPDCFTPAELSYALDHLFKPESCTEYQIGAFLALLRASGLEGRPDMMSMAARCMRERAIRVDLELEDGQGWADLVGTGGDGKDTFNVSTTAALVAAGAGVNVCKVGGLLRPKWLHRRDTVTERAHRRSVLTLTARRTSFLLGLGLGGRPPSSRNPNHLSSPVPHSEHSYLSHPPVPLPLCTSMSSCTGPRGSHPSATGPPDDIQCFRSFTQPCQAGLHGRGSAQCLPRATFRRSAEESECEAGVGSQWG